VADTGRGQAVATGDYDNDGDTDMYLVNIFPNMHPNRLYRNNGTGFVDVATGTTLANPGLSGQTNGAAWGDYDNDGDLDLFLQMSEALTRNVLYQNNGNGKFSDSTHAKRVSDSSHFIHIGLGWADYDNDGDLDLYSGHDYGYRLYSNNGNSPFTDLGDSTTYYPGNSGNWNPRGATWGDYDNDGDLDIFQAHSNKARGLFVNGGGGTNRSLVLKLIGTSTNRSAIGVRVTAVTTAATDTLRQIREVDGSAGYRGQPSLPLEFGLGTATSIDSLIIEWCPGTTQYLIYVPTNQILEVTQNPLVANAGADQTVECVSPSGASVMLNGSSSYDPDHCDSLSYTWTDTSGDTIATGVTPTVILSRGIHIIILTVSHGKAVDTDSVTITVQDTTAPVITLIGANPLILECPAPYIEPGATVTDACDSMPTLIITGTVDSHTPGEYTITYTATDHSGKVSTLQRTVIVQDTTAPVVTLVGANPLILECPAPYIEPGATVTDACDSMPTLIITGTVDSHTPGEYTITYTATDHSGNPATKHRTVIVRDTTPPVITIHPLMELWPPNHQYVPISISQCIAAIFDSCAGTLTLAQAHAAVVSVSCDEPQDVTGNGDGFTLDDIMIASDGQSVQLRAERQGANNGRMYTITVEVEDPSGNKAMAVCQVGVPHDQRPGHVIADDGVSYVVYRPLAKPVVAVGTTEGQVLLVEIGQAPWGWRLGFHNLLDEFEFTLYDLS